MPFDPTFPPDHQELDAAPFRDQFNALNDLIAQSANNVDAVGVSGITFSDPPTAAQLNALQDKLSELIVALHRT